MTYLISRQKQRGEHCDGRSYRAWCIASLFEAGISIIKFVADTESQLPAITYWLMGSLVQHELSAALRWGRRLSCCGHR